MPSSGRVQSACIATTFAAVNRFWMAADSTTSRLLTTQVTHQSAVTSTNTVLPSFTSLAIAASSNGRQRPAGSAGVETERDAANCVGTAKAASARVTTAAGETTRRRAGK